MSEIEKYKKYLNFKANPRYLRRDFIVPLYTGTEPDIVPETSVEELGAVQEFNDRGSVERQGFSPGGISKKVPEGYITGKQLEELTGIPNLSVKAKELMYAPKEYKRQKNIFGDFYKKELKAKYFDIGQGGKYGTLHYKTPTAEQIEKMKEYHLRKGAKYGVTQATADRMKLFHNNPKLRNYVRNGKIIPDELLKDYGVTRNEAAQTTFRLAQAYNGKKFINVDVGITENKRAGKKLFEAIDRAPFGNPYKMAAYKEALNVITEGIGNKYFQNTTFENMKREARRILQKEKISVFDPTIKDSTGININELTGVTASSRNKSYPYSQFINLMEGNLNTKAYATFNKQFEKYEKNLQNEIAKGNKGDPNKIIKEYKNYTKDFLSGLEDVDRAQIEKLGLPELSLKEPTELYGKRRIAQLTKQGLDLPSSYKELGYSIQVPKGTATLKEFINNPEIRNQMIANIGCPTLVSKSIGGRVNFSNGSNCYAKGLEKIQSGELGNAEKRIAGEFLQAAGAASEDVQDVFKGTKTGLKFLQDVVVGLTRPVIAANIGISAATEGENILRGQLNPASRLVESITFGALGGGPTEVADQMLEFGSPGTIKTINHSRTIKKFNDQIESEKNDIENANNTFAEYGIDPTSVILEKEKNIANIEKQKNEFLSNPIFVLTQKDKNDFENDFKKIVKIGLDKGIEGTKKTARFTPEIQATSNEILIDRERFPNFASQLATDLRGTEIENILKPYSDIEKSIIDESTFIVKDPELLKIKNYYQGFKNAGDIIYNEPKPLTDEQRIEIEEMGARTGAAKGGYIDYVKEYRKYARGGRINLSNGGDGNRPKISRRGFLGFLAGVASAPFVAKLFKGKKGIQAAKIAAKVLPEAKGMPEWFNPLITKIVNEGVDISPKATRAEDILKVKKLEIPTPDGKGTDTIIMTKYPDGSIEVDAEVLGGGAFDSPFTLTYKPPKLDIDLTTGKPIKDPGSFYVIEQRPKPDYNDPGNFEIDYETMYVDDAISDIERIEKIATGKRIPPQKVEQRAGARKFVEENPSEDIVNRYGDAEIEYDRMKDEGLLDD